MTTTRHHQAPPCKPPPIARKRRFCWGDDIWDVRFPYSEKSYRVAACDRKDAIQKAMAVRDGRMTIHQQKWVDSMISRIKCQCLRAAEMCDGVYPGSASPTALANRVGAKIWRQLSSFVDDVDFSEILSSFVDDVDFSEIADCNGKMSGSDEIQGKEREVGNPGKCTNCGRKKRVCRCGHNESCNKETSTSE